MALFPNIPFTDGDPWTPELAYEAFQTPVFDGQTQYLGHRAKIADGELSDDPGAVKSRFSAADNALKVSIEGGLTLRYQSGSVMTTEDSQVSIAGGLIAAPDNVTSFVYVDSAAQVVCSAALPVSRLILAKVVAVSGRVSTLEDWRQLALRLVLPVGKAVKVFGGSNALDKVCAQGEVFDQGFYYYRDFTVPAGVSITVDKFAKFFCSGKVSVFGTINITPASAGAAGYSTGCAPGMNIGGLTGGGAGGGSGSTSGGGSGSYSYAAQPFGSGGGLGFASGNTNERITFADGGRGGGGVWFEASGLVEVSGSIFAKGTDGGTATIQSGIPTVSGAGGGSGGLIFLSSLKGVTVSASATSDVRGGVGCNGVGSGAGGSGGGGGFVVLQSPANNTTGSTILLAGGSRGTDPATVNIGGGGGGGFGGAGGNQAAGGTGRFIVRNFTPVG